MFPDTLFEHVTKHSKIIWFLFKKGQETSSLTLKPFGDEIESVNKELSEQFPNVVFFQSFISENPKIMEYFGLNDNLEQQPKRITQYMKNTINNSLILFIFNFLWTK